MNMHAMFRTDLRAGESPEPKIRSVQSRQRRAVAAGLVIAAVAILLVLLFGRSAPPPPAAGAIPAGTVIVPGRSAVAAVITATGSLAATRSEERSVGEECGSPFRSRWSPSN